MQSTRYLKRMSLIANILIVLSKKKALKNINFWPICIRPKKTWRVFKAFHFHVNALKTRHVFLAEYKYVKNLYFFEFFFVESTIKRLAMEPIRFRYVMDCIHSEIFCLKKVLFRQYGQKCGRSVSTWSRTSIYMINLLGNFNNFLVIHIKDDMQVITKINLTLLYT